MLKDTLTLRDRPTTGPFLYPAEAPVRLLTGTPTAPVRPRGTKPRRRAQTLAAAGLDTSGGRVSINDLTTETGQNLRVTCILQRIDNTIVTAPGVGAPAENVTLSIAFASPLVTSANDTPVELAIPAPGASLIGPEESVVFDGLVAVGCGSTPALPLSVDSELFAFDGEPTVFAPFAASDNSTITPNGFWTFDFTIRTAHLNHAGVSDVRVRGLIAVGCTALDSLG